MLMKAFAIFSQVEHGINSIQMGETCQKRTKPTDSQLVCLWNRQPNCKRSVPCMVAGKLRSVYFSYILYPDDKGGFMFSVYSVSIDIT